MTTDLFSILIAGLVAAGIGFLWYHPKVFGAAWMRMAGVTPEQMEQGKRRMPLMAFFALLSSIVAAYVMSYFALAWGVFDWIGAIELAFWCWIGFVAPAMLGQVLWEQKPFKLYLINAGYWFVALVVISLVLLF